MQAIGNTYACTAATAGGAPDLQTHRVQFARKRPETCWRARERRQRKCKRTAAFQTGPELSRCESVPCMW